MSVCDNKTYRVLLHPNTGKVEITCFGLEAIDAAALGDYINMCDTPEWVQRKVAVLTMTSDKPPTETVKGVGRRIDANTFWLFHER